MPRIRLLWISLAVLMVMVVACATPSSPSRSGSPPAEDGRWSIVLHGGAGVVSRNLSAYPVNGYHNALNEALDEGIRRAKLGESALDVAEAVVRILEDQPRFNAGKGAAFTADGTHELDACVMTGDGLKTGAVAGVTTVRHPISLARKVMEHTPHVLLAGAGAEKFADAMKVERVQNSWFDTEHRRALLDEWRSEQKARGANRNTPVGESAFGTVGCVVRDTRGRLAAATSTGGLTGKRYGRVGDAPIAGAGTYADTTCAVSCSGTGEVFIRHGVAREVSTRMRYLGESIDAAAKAVIATLAPGDGGLIAVSADGSMAVAFNTEGLYRGVADSQGRRETRIWED